MKKELQEKLFNDFPLLYERRTLSTRESCLGRGIECLDGWFDIIYEVSKKMAALEKKYKKYGLMIRAEQVKEKFGVYRGYFDFSCTKASVKISAEIRKKMDKINHTAVKKSSKTCEVCGSTIGITQTKGGWIVTLCPVHLKEYHEGVRW